MREPAHHGVGEGHRAFAPRGAHELDRVVDDRMLSQIGEGELIGAEAQRRLHGRVQLANRPLAELLDAEVEHARPLHRSEREPLRERAVACIESRHGGGERAVGVRVTVERSPHDLEGRTTRRRDHRTPRRNSS